MRTKRIRFYVGLRPKNRKTAVGNRKQASLKTSGYHNLRTDRYLKMNRKFPPSGFGHEDSSLKEYPR